MTISVVENKGTELMECMLLQRYHNSPNLKEYIGAFISEFDILFAELQRIELGRQLECAEGAQLDVIGRILDRSRNITIHKEFFGFLNAPLAQSFGTIFDASQGGFFKSQDETGSDVVPIDDGLYRKLLKVRAFVIGTKSRTMDSGEFTSITRPLSTTDVYRAISILIHGSDEDYTTNGLIVNYYDDGNDITVDIDVTQAGLAVQLIPIVIPWLSTFTHKLIINLT